MTIDPALAHSLTVERIRRADLAGAAPASDEIVQIQTIEAVMDGCYDGDVTVAELAGLGDFGIGTLQGLDGELTVIDGEFWNIDIDGRAMLANPAALVPFAVLVDFGSSADAPNGSTPPASLASCASVDADATSMRALSSAFDLRIEDGLVCGIDGYPATGCAEIVDTAQMAMQAAAPESAVEDGADDVLGLGSSPLTAVLTLAAIGLLAFVVLRRRT